MCAGQFTWGVHERGNFFAIFLKNQKPVACKRNLKELKKQKNRAKIEQKSNKI